MGTKSDFAQKLLHDLRQRKERMAAAQNSDAFGNSRQTLKGSRETKTLDTIGSKTGRTCKSSYTSKKSLSTVQTNNQIVPYRSSHHSRQNGDFSMALAYAFDGGGKLKSVDFTGNVAMMDFLKQVSKRSMQQSPNRQWQSTNQFPTLTHLHINEIAKGAQKLNQILRACSGGFNIDKGSVEIGKELWEGAIELQRSLKMLVNLQEASDCMASSQRKSRLKLLEDGEDSEDDSHISTEKQKHVERPVFSFDKSSKNSKGSVLQPATQPKLMALTYLKEVANSKPEKQEPSTSKCTHMNSSSCGPEFQSSRHTNSLMKHDSGKIPNVIAKLMGLEELAQNVNKKVTTGSQTISKERSNEVVSTRKAYRSQGSAELKIEYTKNASMQGIKTGVQRNKVTHQTEPQKETYRVTYNYSYTTIADSQKPRWNREGREEIKNHLEESKQAIYTINELQSQVTQINNYDTHQRDIRKEIAVTRQNQQEIKDNKEKLQTKVEVRNQSSEAANKLIAQTKNNGNFKEAETGGAIKPVLQQKKQKSEFQLQQLQALSVYETQGNKIQSDIRKQQGANKKSELRKIEGKSKILKYSQNMANGVKKLHKKQPTKQRDSAKENDEKANRLPVLIASAGRDQNEVPVRDSSIISFDAKQKNSPCQKPEQGFSLTKRVHAALHLDAKPGHVSAEKMMDVIKPPKIGAAPAKINEVMPRTVKTVTKSGKALKTQKPVLQKRVAKISSSESSLGNDIMSTSTQIISENAKPRPQASQQQIDAEQMATTNNQTRDESHCPETVATLPLIDKTQDTKTSTVSVVQHDQQIVPDETQVPKFQTTATDGFKDSRNISYNLLAVQTRLPNIAKQDPLTEDEMYLKQKLITSNLFLSTAEALFKLNIPISVLNYASDQIIPERGNKLILDCAYEVLKRKGMKDIISFYPHMNKIMSQKLITTLDDLVRQLHKDFKTLRSYGRNGRDEYDDANYLLKMLERDIQYRELDLNCMWDLSWNQMMFAYVEMEEVVRDIEKEVLEELVTEIAKDCMLSSNSIA